MERKIASGIVLTLLLIGMLTLAFNIQTVNAIGTIYIRPDGSIDPPSAPISTRDNVTYTLTDNISDEIVVERDHIVVDGAGYTLQGTGAYLSEGIKLWGRSNITIKNVEVINFYYGIFLVYSNNNTLTENTALNNKDGIRLYHSGNNSLDSNIASNNEWSGIFLDISSDNVLTENTVSNNDDGINLWDSSNNIFDGNIASSNNRYGIWVRTPNTPSNNFLIGNTALNNTFGVYLDYSSNNVLFHNNLINNTFQAGITNGYANTWDDGYPSGGNYWSDYVGVDSDKDGIGDTPYVIDENNQDRYPLMSPWRERTVGVKVGDWAEYSADTSWTGVLDPRLEWLSETEWGMIEVTDVQGTVVTFTGTAHLKNGSELTTPGAKWDIAPTGSFGFIFWFIGSNLQAGDRVYPSGVMTINETITGTYVGVQREINHLNWSTSFSIIPGPPYDLNEFNCYWDQATGILTEYYLEASTEDLSSSLSIHFMMVDTNLWEVPIPTTVGELKAKIEELGSEGEIDNQGIVRGLIAKLNVAQRLIDKEKIDEAKMVLEDFITQVQELSGIHITVEAADILIESAEYILSHL